MSIVLSVILIFLSPPEPLETNTLTPTRITMLVAVPTLWHTPRMSLVISSKGQRWFFLIECVSSTMTGRRPTSDPFWHRVPSPVLPHHQTSPVTRRRSCVSSNSVEPKYGHASTSTRLRAKHRTCPVTQRQCSVTPEWPFLNFQLLNPYSNVLTTKCTILCVCVSNFSQTFSRVLALTRI
jgi:hypothetical protein